MEWEILLRFLLAALWGGIVGAEREYRSKSAGFRTMIMISIGACFFTIISKELGGISNPDRLAAGVVTGIGFLGAGVIFRGESRVLGITTAASIWTVAAVGMAIGAGLYTASAYASILVVIVLAVLPSLENIIDQLHQSRVYTITYALDSQTHEQVVRFIKELKLHGYVSGEQKDHEWLITSWQIRGSRARHEAFISQLKKEKGVVRFSY
ncbi:MgtC/SapB family protein [Terrimonas ferruginea]|uniref:MgtC/SapB family protein n=1 Tax=Terrimonas ferruginea TaxID=249 RepID=UPI0004189CD5|nr:MgtC/SapB family protein [Terrimonas ferruginea]